MHKPSSVFPLAAVPRLHAVGALLLTAFLAGPATAQSTDLVRASQMLDISGVSWIEGDVFVAVHDGKSDEVEGDWPRVSLLMLPADVAAPPAFKRDAAEGIYFKDLEVAWPGPTPNDIESIARIPGTRRMLIVESGDGCKSQFQRIFLASLNDEHELAITDTAAWPASAECASGVFNVEATAVFRFGDRLFFAYAERAEGQPHTEIRWARMHLNPLRFEEFHSARYSAGVRGEGVRPIVSLDVDAAGNVFAAAAYDPDDDNGPFRSWVSRVGQFHPAPGGGARFVPSGKFAGVATQDGYKIEGVAVRPASGIVQVFAGTDDENYGATLRAVAPIP